MTLEELLQEVWATLQEFGQRDNITNLTPDEEQKLADLLREASDALLQDMEEQQV